MNGDILARYKQAQGFTQIFARPLNPMVKNDFVLPSWIEGSQCFWYERATQDGKEFRLVDAREATNSKAFDHKLLANAMSQAVGQTISPQSLPFNDVEIVLSPFQIHFTAFDKRWAFEFDGVCFQQIEAPSQKLPSPYGHDLTFLPVTQGEQQALDSPDGDRAVFVSGYNIWLKNHATGEAKSLTDDGVEDKFYGANALLEALDGAVPALWSPDSQHLLVARWDSRDVVPGLITQYLPRESVIPRAISIKGGLATVDAEAVTTLRLAVVDVATGKMRTADYPLLQYHYLASRGAGFFRAKMAWWSSDNRHVFFIDLSRGSKCARVIEWDTHTGTTRVLIEESSDTFVKLRHALQDHPVFLPLPDSNELIWFSDRSGWAHLYLYDLNTGELKHSITEGEWMVRNVLHYDAKRRELLLQTAARDPSISPYYRDICKVNIDSKELTPLISGDFEHRVYQYLNQIVGEMLGTDVSVASVVHGISPCGEYMVTTRSRADYTPESVLIDRNGKEILTVETADVSGLPTGWCWPEPVKLKSADGETDIYGLVFRPPNFSEDKHYPVVEYCSSSRMVSVLPQGAFNNNIYGSLIYGNACALATLGFIVVIIEGRGTPFRHKNFVDHHYGEQLYTSDFDDRIAGIRKLAERYPYMDIDRVGLVNTENMTNGIFALKYSDFYKVSVHHCFYDVRYGNAGANDSPEGTFDKSPLFKPEDYVESFNGKLLLIQGMMSSTAGATYRLVEALQRAGKDFDMLSLPNLGNNMDGYTIRREWDYLVRHLQGVEPPNTFQLETSLELYMKKPEFRMALDKAFKKSVGDIVDDANSDKFEDFADMI